MKKTITILTFFGAGAFFFSSYNTGAANAGIDRTGSPFSGGQSCGACHNSSSMAQPTVTTTLLDASSNAVTSYTPGTQYTLEVQVNSSTASSYGFQAVALLASNNSQAGSFTTLSSNTRISTLSGRKYPEQNSRSTNGTFQVKWTAPAAGSGNVKIYSVGNATNSNNSDSGDKSKFGTTLTITEQTSTGIEELSASTITLFPNPSSEFIQLNGLMSNKYDLSIFDINGNQVKNIPANTYNPGTPIAISELTSGTFIISITGENAKKSIVFVKS